ncbi:ACP S-malonyltransferase [Micromonospora sp. BL1]|uniref:[acyl-carrier-protein] S-malonyltransferase n=1 Tax=Micromonospora sp. HUAS YX12 TaxID=3156396 RepID=A0AAU7QWU4_9ACTN|nr:ACP S-malonyltransferase [Micromonospora sp. BL1]NED50668.1 ACP S-malonyltransferase [Micromonospora aurantiaca]RLQ03531.1 ACP S-malonyltransferase [Micromonospora sp. BL1]
MNRETPDAVLFNPQVVVEPGDHRDFYDEFPEVHRRMAEASDVLGVDLAARFYAEDPAAINDGTVVRPASVAIAVAICDVIGLRKRPPRYMAGLSLGSIVAAHLGGFMSFRDTIRMVSTMPAVEDRVVAGRPLGVAFYYNVDLDRFQAEMREVSTAESPLLTCAITADNQMIATGAVAGLQELNLRAASIGGVGLVIPYGPPAHSPLPVLYDIKETFAREWSYLDPTSDPQVPQLCNHTGAVIDRREDLMAAFVEQYTRTVRWDLVVRRLADLGVKRVTVVGPGHFVYRSMQFVDVSYQVQTVLTCAELRSAAE